MSKKGENIYKRKDARWEARYIKGYYPNGKIKYGYCYGKTYRDAKQKLSEARAMLLFSDSDSSASRKNSFSFYCDEWLRLSRDRVKESTYVKYYGVLEKYVKPQLGSYSMKSLNSSVIEEFGHDLLYKNKLSPKTVKDILTVLHSIIKYTSNQNSISFSAPEIVYPKIPRKEMRVLTREEQTRFVEYLLDDMNEYKFGILLALLTGMRIGEVCALRWGNISLSNKTVKVDATMQRLKNLDESIPEKTKIVISNPKSNTSLRTIPLTDYTVKLCQKRLCSNASAFVLTGETDRYVEPRSMQYHFERYTKACGLEGVHFHTLRHTFATRCVEVDFEIKSLSEILGHSNPRVTLERYVHSSMELKRENMNKLAAIGY